MKPTIWVLLGALLVSVAAAADPMRFELTDGSFFSGEIIAVEAGELTIDSSALGRVRIAQSHLASMTPVSAAATPEPTPVPAPPSATRPAANTEEMQALGQIMMSDPALQEQISNLSANPLMREILSDPELMQQVLAGDLEALSRDPRIQRLAEDPAVRRVSETLGE
jgi:hypothetical protein